MEELLDRSQFKNNRPSCIPLKIWSYLKVKTCTTGIAQAVWAAAIVLTGNSQPHAIADVTGERTRCLRAADLITRPQKLVL